MTKRRSKWVICPHCSEPNSWSGTLCRNIDCPSLEAQDENDWECPQCGKSNSGRLSCDGCGLNRKVFPPVIDGDLKTQLFCLNILHVQVPLTICGEDFESRVGEEGVSALYPGFSREAAVVLEMSTVEDDVIEEPIRTFLARVLAAADGQDVDEFLFYREHGEMDEWEQSAAELRARVKS